MVLSAPPDATLDCPDYAIVTAVHPQTAQGRMTAVLRQSALASPP